MKRVYAKCYYNIGEQPKAIELLDEIFAIEDEEARHRFYIKHCNMTRKFLNEELDKNIEDVIGFIKHNVKDKETNEIIKTNLVISHYPWKADGKVYLVHKDEDGKHYIEVED